MSKPDGPSLGAAFAQRFAAARRELRQAPRVGARDLPRLVGLNPNGTANAPIENLYAAATEMLAASGKVFVYGENVMLETGVRETLGLQRLTTGSDPVPSASALLANYLTCETAGDAPSYFPPPGKFVGTLLARGPTRDAMPRITAYARRPIYDNDFVLRGPGYDAATGILVHGLDIEPILPGKVDPKRAILQRLSPRLRTLLEGFCFRESADVANALAALLTGVLANHFMRQPKATNHIDANQAGVGKTWLALATGAALDGELPELIHYTSDDEELAKRILSNLRQRSTSVLLVDNAKTRGGHEVSSACLEANSMAPNITLRILGKSVNHTQPNDVLWFLTMNQTRLSPDLASRGMPIRLYYDGDPAGRVFRGPNPLEYALEYRAEILGELFGLVEWWKSRGRPRGTRRHRCEYWAQTVGGILEACGFPEFLGNAAEAAAEFNTELSELAAVAEWVVRGGDAAAYTRLRDQQQEEATAEPPASPGLAATDWLNAFRGARVESERLEAAKSARSRATIIGNFLARMVDREVPIEAEGRTATARLRSATGRARTKLYYFQIRFDDQSETEDGSGKLARPRQSKNSAPGTRQGKATSSPMAESRENPVDRQARPGLAPKGNDETW